MTDDTVKSAAALLVQSSKAVALTGAGVSTESGIPDFRGRDGLWSRYDPMEYGTLAAFHDDPVKIWGMLAELLDIADTSPNAGHQVMARLERQNILHGIITQNIDNLHQKAGSTNVVEFHGSLRTFTCPACRKGYPLAYVRNGKIPPRCAECGAILKPDVVFFDEQIPAAALTGTRKMLENADLMLVIGTSCQVAPASFLPWQLRAQGGKIIEINLEPSLGEMADVVITGGFSSVMNRLEKEVATLTA